MFSDCHCVDEVTKFFLSSSLTCSWTLRSYRDCVKDAQSKVLRSTSLRRRDLGSSVSPPPPAAAPSGPARPQPAEKRGPKTMPKPQGVFMAPQSPPPPIPGQALTSPHTPKERHLVSPDLRGVDPPALPSVPPVGPPALLRICGRKRLVAGQKKRSYSEPDNLNEVGVSDPETVALFRRGGGKRKNVNGRTFDAILKKQTIE